MPASGGGTARPQVGVGGTDAGAAGAGGGAALAQAQDDSMRAAKRRAEGDIGASGWRTSRRLYATVTGHRLRTLCNLEHMLIRPLVADDIPAAADLLAALAKAFILHESSPEDGAAFLAEQDAAAIRRNVDAGFVYHMAFVDGVLAGFIGLRGGTHVHHMFVDARFQRRGIARRLWDVARAAALQSGHPGIFTVNASNVAVPVYLALGFERTAPMQVARVLYNPMRLVCTPSTDSAALVGAA